MSSVLRLYRPVGKYELALIAESGYRRFPPRLPHQPIFYPVLNIEYARKIARDWNTKDEASAYEGYVLQFRLESSFLEQFKPQTVGDGSHVEYWIRAERLNELNEAIVGTISLIETYTTNSSPDGE